MSPIEELALGVLTSTVAFLLFMWSWKRPKEMITAYREVRKARGYGAEFVFLMPVVAAIMFGLGGFMIVRGAIRL